MRLTKLQRDDLDERFRRHFGELLAQMTDVEITASDLPGILDDLVEVAGNVVEEDLCVCGALDHEEVRP